MKKKHGRKCRFAKVNVYADTKHNKSRANTKPKQKEKNIIKKEVVELLL